MNEPFEGNNKSNQSEIQQLLRNSATTVDWLEVLLNFTDG